MYYTKAPTTMGFRHTHLCTIQRHLPQWALDIHIYVLYKGTYHNGLYIYTFMYYTKAPTTMGFIYIHLYVLYKGTYHNGLYIYTFMYYTKAPTTMGFIYTPLCTIQRHLPQWALDIHIYVNKKAPTTTGLRQLMKRQKRFLSSMSAVRTAFFSVSSSSMNLSLTSCRAESSLFCMSFLPRMEEHTEPINTPWEQTNPPSAAWHHCP